MNMHMNKALNLKLLLGASWLLVAALSGAQPGAAVSAADLPATAVPGATLSGTTSGTMSDTTLSATRPPAEDDFAPQNPAFSLTLNGRAVQVEMEDLRHPLMLIQTTRGDFVVELFPDETPNTVAHFVELAEGSGPYAATPYYNGLQIHRVVRDFVIQGGSANNDSSGDPGFSLADEMSADSLGLAVMPLINAQGEPHPLLGIHNAEDFRHTVLEPLYENMGIRSEEALSARLAEVDERLRSMSLQDFFELQGWRYTRARSRAPTRGMIAMANKGPNTIGSQFFITLSDAPWLSGRVTVFGQVRAGMAVVEAIGRLPTGADERPLEPVTILGVSRISPGA